jgi:hypothetical protein
MTKYRGLTAIVAAGALLVAAPSRADVLSEKTLLIASAVLAALYAALDILNGDEDLPFSP